MYAPTELNYLSPLVFRRDSIPWVQFLKWLLINRFSHQDAWFSKNFFGLIHTWGMIFNKDLHNVRVTFITTPLPPPTPTPLQLPPPLPALVLDTQRDAQLQPIKSGLKGFFFLFPSKSFLSSKIFGSYLIFAFEVTVQQAMRCFYTVMSSALIQDKTLQMFIEQNRIL